MHETITGYRLVLAKDKELNILSLLCKKLHNLSKFFTNTFP